MFAAPASTRAAFVGGLADLAVLAVLFALPWRNPAPAYALGALMLWRDPPPADRMSPPSGEVPM